MLAAETTQPKKPPTSTATRRKLFKHLQGGKTPDHHRPPSPPAPSARDPAAARAWYGRGRHGWCGGPGSLLRRVFRPLQKPSADPYFYDTSFPPLFTFSAFGKQRPCWRREGGFGHSGHRARGEWAARTPLCKKPSANPYSNHTSFPPLFAFSAVGAQGPCRRRERGFGRLECHARDE